MDNDVAGKLSKLGANPECPSCGPRNGGNWLVPPGGAIATFTYNTMRTIDVQVVVCPNCGFVRLHGTSFLEDDYIKRRERGAAG